MNRALVDKASAHNTMSELLEILSDSFRILGNAGKLFIHNHKFILVLTSILVLNKVKGIYDAFEGRQPTTVIFPTSIAAVFVQRS